MSLSLIDILISAIADHLLGAAKRDLKHEMTKRVKEALGARSGRDTKHEYIETEAVRKI